MLDLHRAFSAAKTPSPPVSDVSAEKLKHVIQSQFGGTATCAETALIWETFEGMVWDGVVYVFELSGHPEANRAYTWSTHVAGTNRYSFHAVLGMGGIKSPLDAVRAALVADNRGF